jgi:hypothetical protein
MHGRSAVTEDTLFYGDNLPILREYRTPFLDNRCALQDVGLHTLI